MDVVEKLLRVNQHGGSNSPAPHKPLLLLLALSKFVTTGSSELDWKSEVELVLPNLLARLGERHAGALGAAYPFTRLRNDGIWILSRNVSDDSLAQLRAAKISGRFHDDVEVELVKRKKLALDCARNISKNQFGEKISNDRDAFTRQNS